MPSLFPENSDYLNALCENIFRSHSALWPQLNHKMPDNAFCFNGAKYGFPGFIVEVADSQNWEGGKGVKNKAIQYEDDSGGAGS